MVDLKKKKQKQKNIQLILTLQIRKWFISLKIIFIKFSLENLIWNNRTAVWLPWKISMKWKIFLFFSVLVLIKLSIQIYWCNLCSICYLSKLLVVENALQTKVGKYWKLFKWNLKNDYALLFWKRKQKLCGLRAILSF